MQSLVAVRATACGGWKWWYVRIANIILFSTTHNSFLTLTNNKIPICQAPHGSTNKKYTFERFLKAKSSYRGTTEEDSSDLDSDSQPSTESRTNCNFFVLPFFLTLHSYFLLSASDPLDLCDLNLSLNRLWL